MMLDQNKSTSLYILLHDYDSEIESKYSKKTFCIVMNQSFGFNRRC